MALSDNLIAYWSLDEASGNAIDAHGSNDLTETSGTIASATGKVGNARDFELGDTEYFEIADNTDLSTGDIDFSFAFWIKPEVGIIGIVGYPLVKGSGSGADYYVELTAATKLRWYVYGAGGFGSGSHVQADTFGAISGDNWYFVVVWHDASANQIGISINGTADTASHSAGVVDGAHVFRMGAYPDFGAYWDGLIDEVGFWKRVLTSDERAELYNDGDGRDYAYITGGGGGGEPIEVEIGLVSETDTAQPVDWSPMRRLLGINTETDTAQTHTRSKSKAVGLNSETDTAQTVDWSPMRRLLGLNSETDTSQTLATLKQKAIGLNTETDTAQTVDWSPMRRLLGITSETDTSQAVQYGNIITLGLNQETDTSQSVGKTKQKSVGLNSETDISQTVAHTKSVALGLNSETDTSQTVAHRKFINVGFNTETDVSQSVGKTKQKATGVCTETDLAQTVSRVIFVSAGLNTETDSSQSVIHTKKKTLGLTTEVDISLNVIFVGETPVLPLILHHHGASLGAGGSL